MKHDALIERLQELKNVGFFKDLIIERGIEKEFFRTDANGFISKNHILFLLDLPSKIN